MIRSPWTSKLAKVSMVTESMQNSSILFWWIWTKQRHFWPENILKVNIVNFQRKISCFPRKLALPWPLTFMQARAIRAMAKMIVNNFKHFILIQINTYIMQFDKYVMNILSQIILWKKNKIRYKDPCVCN